MVTFLEHCFQVSSSSLPASVSQRCSHIRALVFHTLHRGLRNTILCLCLVKFTMLVCLYFCHIILPHMTQHPPPPPFKSRLYIASFPLANCTELSPPPFSVRYRSTLPSPPLWIHLILRFPTTVGNSEPSLTARLWRAPANAWLASPESAQPGAPAPE